MSDMVLMELWSCRDEFDVAPPWPWHTSIEDEVAIGPKVDTGIFDGSGAGRHYHIVLLPTAPEDEAIELAAAAICSLERGFFCTFRFEFLLESVGFSKKGVYTYIIFTAGPGASWLDEPRVVGGVDQCELLKEAIVLVARESDWSVISERPLALSERFITPRLKAMVIHSAAMAKSKVSEATAQDIVDLMLVAWRSSGRDEQYLIDAVEMAASLGIPFSEDKCSQLEHEIREQRLEEEMNSCAEVKDYFMDGMK